MTMCLSIYFVYVCVSSRCAIPHHRGLHQRPQFSLWTRQVGVSTFCRCKRVAGDGACQGSFADRSPRSASFSLPPSAVKLDEHVITCDEHVSFVDLPSEFGAFCRSFPCSGPITSVRTVAPRHEVDQQPPPQGQMCRLLTLDGRQLVCFFSEPCLWFEN